MSKKKTAPSYEFVNGYGVKMTLPGDMTIGEMVASGIRCEILRPGSVSPKYVFKDVPKKGRKR